MSDHIEKTISEVQQQIDTIEADLTHKKKMVNDLCELAGRKPLYHDIKSKSPSHGRIRRDQFYGRPLASVAREILEMRNEALTVNEIFDVMLEGGYAFDAKNKSNAKRALRISLSKNTATFHKLPNGTFGLIAWYPNVKAPSNGKPKEPEEDDDVMAEKLSDEFKDSEKETSK